MIWFNIKELEKLIKDGKLSDKLVFNYLLTYLIFSVVAGYPSNFDNPLWMEWVHLIISLIAVIWGVRKTFEINQEGNNQDYFKRFISLSFVTGIRVVVFALLVLFLFNLLTEILDATGVPFSLSSFQEEILKLAGFLLVIGFYYYMLLASFKRINSGEFSGIQVEAV